VVAEEDMTRDTVNRRGAAAVAGETTVRVSYLTKR
jgi:hypothetical protein